MTDLPFDMRSEGWDSAAAAYDRSVRRLLGPYGEEALELLDLGSGERLLEVAAGPGTITLAAARTGASVTATDFAPHMVERLRANLNAGGVGGVTTAVMDGQALDLPDDSFDALCCAFGLMFFPDKAKGCAEAARVLAPGGRAAYTTWADPAQNRGLTIWREAVERVMPDLPIPDGPPPVFSLADPDTLAGLLTGAGFEDVDVRESTHDWTFSSPEACWDEMHDASPVFFTVLQAVPQHADALRSALVDLMHAEFGDGEVVVPATANIAVGRLPS